ncbi:MAG: hypothetical protein WC485_00240 [Opitutaceae bacterium]
MEERFTATQRAILKILSDGRPHLLCELHACLPDELSGESAVRWHLTGIRKVLRLIGEDVICEFSQACGTKRKLCYRHVRLLAAAVE